MLLPALPAVLALDDEDAEPEGEGAEANEAEGQKRSRSDEERVDELAETVETRREWLIEGVGDWGREQVRGKDMIDGRKGGRALVDGGQEAGCLA
jgi:hypothetical protein